MATDVNEMWESDGSFMFFWMWSYSDIFLHSLACFFFLCTYLESEKTSLAQVEWRLQDYQLWSILEKFVMQRLTGRLACQRCTFRLQWFSENLRQCRAWLWVHLVPWTKKPALQTTNASELGRELRTSQLRKIQLWASWFENSCKGPKRVIVCHVFRRKAHIRANLGYQSKVLFKLSHQFKFDNNVSSASPSRSDITKIQIHGSKSSLKNAWFRPRHMEHQVRLCEGLVAFLGVLSLWIRTFFLTANVCNFWSEPPWILQLTSCLITIFTALIQASMSKATFLAAFTISVLRGRSAISLKSISNSWEIWMCWVAIDHRGINGFWKYKYLVCSAVAIGIRVCLPQRFQRNYWAEKKTVQSWLFPMAKSLRPSVKARTFTRTPPRKTNGSSQWWVYTNRVHLDSPKTSTLIDFENQINDDKTEHKF